jgi:hypothetical protein
VRGLRSRELRSRPENSEKTSGANHQRSVTLLNIQDATRTAALLAGDFFTVPELDGHVLLFNGIRIGGPGEELP